jgi:DNA repair exonuclease SbcCD ATPase subunit
MTKTWTCPLCGNVNNGTECIKGECEAKRLTSDELECLAADNAGRAAADILLIDEDFLILQPKHRRHLLATWVASRRPLVEEVARLRAELEKANARVDDYERLHQADEERIAYLENEEKKLRSELSAEVDACEKLAHEGNDLRAKLEAANRAAKHLDEKLHSRDLEIVELSAELERRQPVDRSAAIAAARRVLNYEANSTYPDNEAFMERAPKMIVDAVLGAAKAEPGMKLSFAGNPMYPVSSKPEPPAFTPSPTGEAPTEALRQSAVKVMKAAYFKVHGELLMRIETLEWDSYLREFDAVYALIAADHAKLAKRVRELEKLINQNIEADKTLMWERDEARSRFNEARTQCESARAEVERLKAEASRPCPADGMSDWTLGGAIDRAGQEHPEHSGQAWDAMGKLARELFGKGKSCCP